MTRQEEREALNELDKQADTREKLRLLSLWIVAEGTARAERRAYGQVSVVLTWQDGHLKEFKILEETVVRNLEQMLSVPERIDLTPENCNGTLKK